MADALAGGMASEESMAALEGAAQSMGAAADSYLTEEFAANVGNELSA